MTINALLKPTEMYSLTDLQGSRVKMSPGPALSEESRGESVHAFLLVSDNLSISWLVDATLQSLPPSSRDILLCFWVSSPLLMRTPVVLDLGLSVTTVTLPKHDYIYKDFISK